ncbi:MAG: hypothetical protein SFW67_31400 [Myxococcaceae bacterium]|nr:hypothetical protein [Myxococcaceae bacterium]
MNKTSAFFLASALGALVGFACGTPPARCSVATCGGCCDATGTCQGGNSLAACGLQGNMCSVCGIGQACVTGACTTASATGGGSAGGSGGGTGGGSGGGSAGGAAGGSAGGMAGGAAGGTAGGAAGGAAGGSAGGAGGGLPPLLFDAGMPPSVPITFAANCNAVPACGGALPGLWHYGSVCIEDTAFSRIQQLCGGAAQTQILNKSGMASGAVLFTSNQMARAVSGSVNFTATTTNTTCVAGFMGIGGCTNLPSLLGQAGITGTCALSLPDGGASSNTCTCDLSFAFNDTANETYTTANNTITTSTNRTFEYCVAGSTLTYEETTPTSVMNIARDPGVSTLSRQ